MHSTNEHEAHKHVGGWSRGRWAPLSTGVLVGMGLLLGGAPKAQATTEDPMWPLASCVDGKLTAGQGYRVLQSYGNTNTSVGRCKPTSSGGLGLACRHGAVDLQLDGDTTNLTVGKPVFAMADGEVLEIITWGDEGSGVLVEHDNGTVAHYVHLSNTYVKRGEPVRQGQPVGTVMDYPDGVAGNDHLHLEFRTAELTVKTCPNVDAKKECDDPTDFNWECKGNGYAVDQAGTTTVDVASYGFVDPSGGLVTGELPATGGQWAPPADAPWVDLRFAPNDGFRNYGSGGGSASGGARVDRPYPDLPADFCDQVGRLDAGASLSYAGAAETSFANGVVLDLDLKLDQITSTEYVDVIRGGDADHTTWRLAVRLNPDSGTRELAFRVTLAREVGAAAEGGDVPDAEGGDLPDMGEGGEMPPDMGAGAGDAPATEYVVSEIVGTLPEPQCRAEAEAASCSDHVGGTPDACAVPTNCDPDAGVALNCFSDFGYRQWHHVAARYDEAAGTFQLLLDGEAFGSTAFVDGSLQNPAGTFTVYIGGAAAAVDDVRVWPLSSLSGDKDDDFDPFGGAPRGANESGCQCHAGSTPTGMGGSLLLLLGLWGLRRRRVA